VAAISRDFRRSSASTLDSSDLVADGPLMRLPAGEAKLAVGLEWRTESLALQVPIPTDPEEPTVAQRYGRRVVSAYSQLHVPLVGAAHDGRAPPRLTLDVAGRYDHYSDFGGTFNPMARLEWITSDWLKLRASWGRSYRAPTLDDLYDTSQNVSGLTVVPDPSSPTGSSLVLAEQGSNPNLREETARTWTAGIDFAPWRGTRLSLTYYDIDYWNRIEQPAADDPLAILEDESEWAEVITRSPTAAEIAAICESPQFVGPVASCLASHPAAIVDLRLANLSATQTRGLDIEASERFVSRWGHFHFRLRGSDVLRFEQSLTPNSPAVSILDTLGNPLSVRLRGVVGWAAHAADAPGWGVDLAVNYTGSYRDPGSTLVPGVRAWTTLDVLARYRLNPGRLGQTTIQLNAVNALNESPPFVDDEFGYDIDNVQALGRVLSLQVTQCW
jgi:outer membrane receptor protein involved in Fe transport